MCYLKYPNLLIHKIGHFFCLRDNFLIARETNIVPEESNTLRVLWVYRSFLWTVSNHGEAIRIVPKDLSFPAAGGSRRQQEAAGSSRAWGDQQTMKHPTISIYRHPWAEDGQSQKVKNSEGHCLTPFKTKIFAKGAFIWCNVTLRC